MCGILVPWPGIGPTLPTLEGKVLTTGLPEKSLEIFSRTLSNPFLVDLFVSAFFWRIYSSCCLITLSCPTLCIPMDCSPPGSSVHEISQARILEWVAISYSRARSQTRNQTCIPCFGRQILYHWTTRQRFLIPVRHNFDTWELFWDFHFSLPYFNFAPLLLLRPLPCHHTVGRFTFLFRHNLTMLHTLTWVDSIWYKLQKTAMCEDILWWIN